MRVLVVVEAQVGLEIPVERVQAGVVGAPRSQASQLGEDRALRPSDEHDNPGMAGLGCSGAGSPGPGRYG